MSVLLFIDAEPRWLRIADGAIVTIEAGLPTLTDDEALVAVVPAREVTLHHASLPRLTEVQARAAARLMVAENSAGDVGGLHVAVGPENADGERTIVAIEASVLAGHIATLAAAGLDPNAVIAAPTLLPRPIAGWARAMIGDETVLRGRDAAFVDDAMLTPAVTAGAEIVTLDRSALEDAILTAVASPEVDLRQGPFARPRRWGIDWKLVRRLALFGALLALATLAVQVATVIKLNATAARIEAANGTRAQAALPPGTLPGPDPAAQLDARLVGLGGAGSGFVALVSAVTAAINDTANAELAGLSYDGAGGLRVTVRAGGPVELTAVATRIRERGLNVVEGAAGADPTRPTVELTVTAR